MGFINDDGVVGIEVTIPAYFSEQQPIGHDPQ